MRSDVSRDQLIEAQGQTVYDRDGEKIGTVSEIFYDRDTGRAEWVGVGTGIFGMKRVLVPLEDATIGEGSVTVPYTRDHVKDSPGIDGDEISEETERSLYAHYGLPWSGERSESTLPADGRSADGATGSTDAAVTRSEEELVVGTERVERGNVRLRKWVETTTEQATVAVQRETARVQREPVDQVVTGVELGEQEVEITLHEEVPVVDKQTVARERVALDTDVRHEQETVSGEVRRERVEIEGDVTDPAVDRP